MRFTLRESGFYRATVVVKHCPGSADLARFLCRNEGRGYGFDGPCEDGTPGTEMTRGQLAAAFRGLAKSEGADSYADTALDTWDEELSKDQALRVVRWAIDTVRRLHPELDDDRLRDYEAEWDWDLLDVEDSEGPSDSSGPAEQY